LDSRHEGREDSTVVLDASTTGCLPEGTEPDLALNLSDVQHQRLLAILADEDQRIRALLESEASEALRRAIQGIREETEARILALLEPEQQEQYRAMLEAAEDAPEKEG